jgi:hypothetical protein
LRHRVRGLLAFLAFAANAQLLFGCVTNVIPFGVTIGQMTNASIGTFLTMNSADIGSGKEGKLDLQGYLNTAEWQADMLALGCGCQVCLGEVPTLPGNSRLSEAFSEMVGGVFVMPIVDQFDISGNTSANIIGFVLVKLISMSGNGLNWTGTAVLLSAAFPLNELTADSDGDGQSDFAEYFAGTDPTNSASAVRISSVIQTNNDILITWQTTGGHTNVVQAAPDLSGSYSNVSLNIVITGSGDATTNFLDSGAATNGPSHYYRVRLVP